MNKQELKMIFKKIKMFKMQNYFNLQIIKIKI